MNDDARDIRDFLQAEAERAPRPIGITEATVRSALLKRAGFLTSSLLLVTILTGGIALAVTGIGGDDPLPPAQNERTPDLNPRVTATIAVGQYPRAVEVLGGYVWVTVDDPDSGFALIRIDPRTNEVVDSLPLTWAADLAVGAGDLWVITFEYDIGARLLRVDPQTNSVLETIRLDCITDGEVPDCFPGNLAADDSAVWITLSSDPANSGEVVRIDPATNRIVARIPIDKGGPRDIVMAGGSVWVNVLSYDDGDAVPGGSLIRIDAEANQVVANLFRQKLLLGGDEFPPVMAAGESDLWVVDAEAGGSSDPVGVVAVRIDAGTGGIIAESERLGSVGGLTVFPFAANGDEMWFFGGGDVAVNRLDTETLRVDQTVDFSALTNTAIDAVLDPITGTIWVASYEGPVVRIDLR